MSHNNPYTAPDCFFGSAPKIGEGGSSKMVGSSKVVVVVAVVEVVVVGGVGVGVGVGSSSKKGSGF